MRIRTLAVIACVLIWSSAALAADKSQNCLDLMKRFNEMTALDGQIDDQLEILATRFSVEEQGFRQMSDDLTFNANYMGPDNQGVEERQRILGMLTLLLEEIRKTSQIAHDMRIAHDGLKQPLVRLRAAMDAACYPPKATTTAAGGAAGGAPSTPATPPPGRAYLKFVEATDDVDQLSISDKQYGQRYVGFGKDAVSIDYYGIPGDAACTPIHLTWSKPDEIMQDDTDYTITLTGTMKPPTTCATNLDLALNPMFAGTTTDMNGKVDKLEFINFRAGIYTGMTSSGLTPSTMTRTFTIHPTSINANSRSSDDYAMVIIIGSASITYHYKIEK